MPSSSAPRLGVALVTGAAQGIGAAVALRLANDGYDIALVDLPSQKSALFSVKTQVEETGRKATTAQADVTQEEAVQAMVKKCVDEHGEINVVVANAGIVRWGSLLKTTAADWDLTFSVNARGVFLCYKYAAEQMIKQGKGGRIIGASSSSGKQGAAGLAAYSASKFAIRGLTQVAAQELAPHNITVNCYAPSFVNTPMLSHEGDEQLGGRGGWIKSTYSLPLLSTDVVTELVSYLVKPAAHIVTGETLNLNGTISFD